MSNSNIQMNNFMNDGNQRHNPIVGPGAASAVVNSKLSLDNGRSLHVSF
jgi:hypothetical protein